MCLWNTKNVSLWERPNIPALYIFMKNKVIVLSTLACRFGREGSKAQFVFDNQAELAAARMGSQQVAVYRANLGLMLVVL